MSKVLAILEVSQKQAYIFSSRKLAVNIRHSNEIVYVTSSEYFSKFPELYQENKNLVYSGGGHTVLQFDARKIEDARATASSFLSVLTKNVRQRFPTMELFVKQIDYDERLTPGQNMLNLSQALEEKKALRRASFYLHRFGVEASVPEEKFMKIDENPIKYGEWEYTSDAEKMIAGAGDNFLAIVHIDGNSMGARVSEIYEKCGNDWEACKETLRMFSSEIDKQYVEAYNEMQDEILKMLNPNEWKNPRNGKVYLPIRKVIGAGDDICFITVGKLGLSCAVSLLKHLEGKVNKADKRKYTACAGMVLIHQKYPFRRAYDLSESLCSNAKVFVAENGGDFCAIDWHVEYGQMKDALGEIREDFQTEDGNYLSLRPFAVTKPVNNEVDGIRTLDFFTKMLHLIKDNKADNARSKAKQLRTAFRYGTVESTFEIKKQSAVSLIKNAENAVGNMAGIDDDLRESGFVKCKDGKIRNLLFDAIELSDRVI